MLHAALKSLIPAHWKLSYKTRHNPSFHKLHIPVRYRMTHSNIKNSVSWLLGPRENAGLSAPLELPPHAPPAQESLKPKMCLTSVHRGAQPFPHYLLLDGSAILFMYHWRTLKSPARGRGWSPTYHQVLELLQVLFLYQACCWSLLSRSWPNSQSPQSAKMPWLSVGNCAFSHLCYLLEVPQSSVAHASTVLQTWTEELFHFFFNS